MNTHHLSAKKKKKWFNLILLDAVIFLNTHTHRAKKLKKKFIDFLLRAILNAKTADFSENHTLFAINRHFNGTNRRTKGEQQLDRLVVPVPNLPS